MKRFVLILFLLFSGIVHGEVKITEIMFNPGDNNEWVEFYNLGNETNLTGAEISDNYQTDQIVCCIENCSFIISANSYFFITDKDTALNITGKQALCVDDTLIGNGLGNSGDSIILSILNLTLVNFTYNQSAGKGRTLALINYSWIEATPTPFCNNSFFEQVINESENEEKEKPDIEILFNANNIYAFVEYGSLIQLHNKDYPGISEEINLTTYYNYTYRLDESASLLLFEGFSNASFKHTKQVDTKIYFNESNEFTFCAEIFLQTLSEFEDKNTTNNKGCINISVEDSGKEPCNISLSIFADKLIYEKNETIGFDNVLSNDTFFYEIEYWAENLLGKETKERVKTNNLNKKHFSPDFDEEDYVYIIKSNLTKLFCNNTNNHTFSEALVIVRGDYDNYAGGNKNSSINITKYPQETSFGDAIDVDIFIYKGDTRKTLVEAYLTGKEKISYVTGAKIKEKFKEIELSLPIQLKDNCDGRYNSGEYTLIVTGLDINETREIIVNKNTGCPEVKKTKTSQGSSISPAAIQPKNKLYELVSVKEDILSSEIISTVRINNNEDKNHSYDVWSYLYKGSASYSGDRESNKVNLNIQASSSEEVTLRSRLVKSPPKDLLLKIKIVREDRKTPYEITQNISISFYNQNESVTEEMITELPEPDFFSEAEARDNDFEKENSETKESNKQNQRITGSVVYKSNTEKIKKYSPLFLILTSLLGVIAFIKLRPKKENIF